MNKLIWNKDGDSWYCKYCYNYKDIGHSTDCPMREIEITINTLYRIQAEMEKMVQDFEFRNQELRDEVDSLKEWIKYYKSGEGKAEK